MKYFKTALICLFLWVPTFGQNQKLTLEDAVVKRFQLFPENIQGLSWRPGTGSYTRIDQDDAAVPYLKMISAKKNKETVLFSLEELQKAFKDADLTPPRRIPRPSWHDEDHLFIQQAQSTALFNVKDKSVQNLASWKKGAEHLEVNKKTGAVAYTRGKNVFVTLPGKEELMITTAEEDGTVTNGQGAHRFEFGISKGLFWSPNGKKLAYYSVEEKDVTEYPIMDLSQQPAGADMVRYPMAGANSHYAQLCVYDTETGKTAFISPRGDKEDYLTNISWAPDGNTLFIAELNRDQNHLKFNHYSAAGKYVATLFEEKDSKYIEPKHTAWFLPDSNDEFIWWSRRDKFTHLYHYNLKGELLGQLTSGEWEVTRIHGMNAKKTSLFVTGTAAKGSQRQFYKIDLGSKELTKLTTSGGVHGAILQPKGDYFLDTRTATTIGRQITLMDTKGKQVRQLLNAKNPLDDYAWGSMKIFSIKGKDGSDLWCRMFLPPNFDPNKKYPVIDYVYGGPGVQIILDTWNGAGANWMNWAAQEGYIVFTLENRGTANRGAKFEQATFQNLGKAELEDQLAGVEYLKSLNYVDSERMAIHGWSYGGFMTTSLMLKAANTFKVGVAGGPVMDWSMYEIMYTERYMDTPQSNPEGYKNANLLNFVEDLEGDLLLIHGTSDDVVLWQHSLAFIKKCVESGVQIDYFVYPMHPHNVRGKDRLHLMQKVLGYIMDRIG